MDWERWHDLAAAQFGSLSSSQADTPSELRAWQRRTETCGWEQSYRGVHSLPWTASPERAIVQALLWVGRPALATGWSALWLHGLIDHPPERVEILAPHGRRHRRHDRALVRRSHHFDAAGGAFVRDVPCAAAAWSVTDVTSRVAVSQLRNLLIDGRQRQLFSLDEVEQVLATRAPLRGAGKARPLLASLAAVQPDSPLEDAIRGRVAADDRLPPPAPAPVDVECPDGWRVAVDVGWPADLVGIDCHGKGSHGARPQLEKDVLRGNGLRASPWRVFEATWQHVRSDEAWDVLAGFVLAAMAGRRGITQASGGV